MTLIHLKAGPLAVDFDPDTAFLRYVRVGTHEALRAVYPAVRDQDWNTVPYRLHDLIIDQSDASFQVSFAARSQRPDIPFDWHGTVTGTKAGQIAYQFRGVASGPFLRNRIGLCVLHPIQSCAGQACTIEHVDGTTSHAAFPATVAPDQPFFRVRSLQHRVSPGLDVRVTMTGDTFETEDQRNWTDGSYKTYGTPLELPFPVEVPAGTVIEQRVVVEPVGSLTVTSHSSASPSSSPQITVDWDQRRRRPALGLQLGPAAVHRHPSVRQTLGQLRPDHLRVDLLLDGQSWRPQWHDAVELASAIGCRLEVALHVDSASLDQAAEELDQLHPSAQLIARWLVYDRAAEATPDWLGDWAAGTLKSVAPSVPIVVGTNAFFAELNRHWPRPVDGQPVCFSINPQVHGSDKLTMIETLDSHRWLVDTVAQRLKTASVISPVTLKPRFNPNATSGAADAESARHESIDDRQPTGFVAAWTAAVLAGLIPHAQVDSVTLYETAGPLGIMTDQGQPWPVADVLAQLLASQSVAPAISTRPLQVAACGLEHSDGSRHVLLANLTLTDVTVELSGPTGEPSPVVVPAESALVISERQA